MSTITVGGIGFGNATPAPGGGGTLTNANNGLSLSGTVVQLGGTLNKNTLIDPAGFDLVFFSTTGAGRAIYAPTPGVQNSLLVVGSGAVTQGSSNFNVIGDFAGVPQQKAMFIGDESTADGIEVYFDSNQLTFIPTNSNSTFRFASSGVFNVDNRISADSFISGSGSNEFNVSGGFTYFNCLPVFSAAVNINSDALLNSQLYIIDNNSTGVQFWYNAGTGLQIIFDTIVGEAIYIPGVVNLFGGGGAISYGDPGSGAGQWKLGKVIAGAVALDAANYVEVEIDGVVVKLLIAV